MHTSVFSGATPEKDSESRTGRGRRRAEAQRPDVHRLPRSWQGPSGLQVKTRGSVSGPREEQPVGVGCPWGGGADLVRQRPPAGGDFPARSGVLA